MAGKDIKVGIKLLDINRHMWSALSAINQYFGPRAMGQADHFFNGMNSAQGVGYMRHRYDLGLFIQQRGIFLEVKLAAVINRNDLQNRLRGLRT